MYNVLVVFPHSHRLTTVFNELFETVEKYGLLMAIARNIGGRIIALTLT